MTWWQEFIWNWGPPLVASVAYVLLDMFWPWDWLGNRKRRKEGA